MEVLRRDFQYLVDLDLASSSKIEVKGYEIYLVEQWILERRLGTIITSFTGNNNHTLQAIKLTIAKDENYWPVKLKKYLNELIKFHHAKLKAFHSEGYLFVTNLSSFYSDTNLNIRQINPIYSVDDYIPFPVNYRQFEANFNLKRLNCGGRSALLFSDPPKASEDKFFSMYKVHEGIPIVYAIKELVMLVQIALYYFDAINPTYCDGILCNKTQDAIDKWWLTIGGKFFGSVPKDGILGPKTVAAILSVLIACKLRLNLITSDSSKDPFDIITFKLSIYHFQKNTCKFKNQSWLLDVATFNKLIAITDEKLNYDNLLKFKKAVNKTVNDISRRSNRVNNINIETLNIDELKLNAHGKRLDYLFLGKGRPQVLTNVLLDIYYTQKKYIDKPETRFFEHLGNEIGSSNNSLDIQNPPNIKAVPLNSDPLTTHAESSSYAPMKGTAVNYMNAIKNVATQKRKGVGEVPQGSLRNMTRDNYRPVITANSFRSPPADEKYNDELGLRGTPIGSPQDQTFQYIQQQPSVQRQTHILQVQDQQQQQSPQQQSQQQQQQQQQSPHHHHHHHHRHHHSHSHGHHHHHGLRTNKFFDDLPNNGRETFSSNNPLKSGVGKIKNLHARTKSIPLKILTNEAEDDDNEVLENGISKDINDNIIDIDILMSPQSPLTPMADRAHFGSPLQETFVPIDDTRLLVSVNGRRPSYTSSNESDSDPYENRSYYANSNASIEGMLDEGSLANKQQNEASYSQNITNALNRRSSVPLISSDINAKMIGYDYETITGLIDNNGHIFDRKERRRSFSTVEDCLLLWKNDFEVPVEVLAKVCINTKINYLRTLKNAQAYGHSLSGKEQVDDQKKNMSFLQNNKLRRTSTDSKGSIASTSLGSLLPTNLASTIKKFSFAQFVSYLQQSQYTLIKKIEILHKNLNTAFQFKRIYESKRAEIDSLISKLKYEVRILKIRVRDVDDSSNELTSKINSLKEIKQVNEKVDEARL